MKYKVLVDVDTTGLIDSALIIDEIVNALQYLPQGFWFTVEEIIAEQPTEE